MASPAKVIKTTNLGWRILRCVANHDHAQQGLRSVSPGCESCKLETVPVGAYFLLAFSISFRFANGL
jgi:hypothetical protein